MKKSSVPVRDVTSEPYGGQRPVMSRPSTFPKAFTLVELLVVIAIVALLAALLSPALKQARMMGRQIKCQSNLRQFHLAFLQYANDNGGQLPIVMDANPPYVWMIAVGGYVGAPGNVLTPLSRQKIWNCPENKVQEWTGGMSLGEIYNSYTVNGYPDPANDGGVVMGYAGTRFDDVARPALAYLIGDGYYFHYAFWDNTGASLPPTGTGAGCVRYPHSGKLNMCFVDGHVETLIKPLKYAGDAPLNWYRR